MIPKLNKPHKCTLEGCTKSFSTKFSLKRHVMTHRSERPFKCHYCGKGFVLHQYLKQHIYTHTGQKPYVCKLCGKCFRQAGKLSIHKKSHRSEQSSFEQMKLQAAQKQKQLHYLQMLISYDDIFNNFGRQAVYPNGFLPIETSSSPQQTQNIYAIIKEKLLREWIDLRKSQIKQKHYQPFQSTYQNYPPPLFGPDSDFCRSNSDRISYQPNLNIQAPFLAPPTATTPPPEYSTNQQLSLPKQISVISAADQVQVSKLPQQNSSKKMEARSGEEAKLIKKEESQKNIQASNKLMVPQKKQELSTQYFNNRVVVVPQRNFQISLQSPPPSSSSSSAMIDLIKRVDEFSKLIRILNIQRMINAAILLRYKQIQSSTSSSSLQQQNCGLNVGEIPHLYQ